MKIGELRGTQRLVKRAGKDLLAAREGLRREDCIVDKRRDREELTEVLRDLDRGLAIITALNDRLAAREKAYIEMDV